MNIGTRIITNGIASSPIPNTAPPKENSVIRIGDQDDLFTICQADNTHDTTFNSTGSENDTKSTAHYQGKCDNGYAPPPLLPAVIPSNT